MSVNTAADRQALVGFRATILTYQTTNRISRETSQAWQQSNVDLRDRNVSAAITRACNRLAEEAAIHSALMEEIEKSTGETLSEIDIKLGIKAVASTRAERRRKKR